MMQRWMQESTHTFELCGEKITESFAWSRSKNKNDYWRAKEVRNLLSNDFQIPAGRTVFHENQKYTSSSKAVTRSNYLFIISDMSTVQQDFRIVKITTLIRGKWMCLSFPQCESNSRMGKQSEKNRTNRTIKEFC